MKALHLVWPGPRRAGSQDVGVALEREMAGEQESDEIAGRMTTRFANPIRELAGLLLG